MNSTFGSSFSSCIMNRMDSTRQQWNPDIRIRKCKPSVHVQLKMHNYRKPDEGLCIQVSIPSSRAKIDNSSGSMLYVGRYLGHGQSKTAFELMSISKQRERFDGKVLKVAGKWTRSLPSVGLLAGPG